LPILSSTPDAARDPRNRPMAGFMHFNRYALTLALVSLLLSGLMWVL